MIEYSISFLLSTTSIPFSDPTSETRQWSSILTKVKDNAFNTHTRKQDRANKY